VIGFMQWRTGSETDIQIGTVGALGNARDGLGDRARKERPLETEVDVISHINTASAFFIKFDNKSVWCFIGGIIPDTDSEIGSF